MKAQYIWIISAVLCGLYGTLVMSAGSGSRFYFVWYAFGGLFALFAYLAHIHLWSGLPAALKAILLILLSCGLAYFIFTEARIVNAFSGKDEKGLDVILVLGAQVYEDRPSTVLKYRLDKAVEYLRENEDTVCIVSGGQGYNEPFPEAYGMKEYMVSSGIDPERITCESASKDTKENMEFSIRLLDPKNDRVGLITNNFHMYRALKLAKNAGIAKVYALPADSTPLFLPSNLLREFFALMTV